MKKFVLTIAAVSGLLLMSGCETTSARPYAPSTENVLKFQSALTGDTKVKLGGFSEGALGSLSCRLAGPVDVSPGKTKADYIKEAMQSELFLAQVYDVNGDIELTGSLDSLEFSSVSPANWTFNLTVKSNKSEGYSVETVYPFKTSFSAISACRNVADAWGPAVQQLIRNVIEHPEFNSLIGK